MKIYYDKTKPDLFAEITPGFYISSDNNTENAYSIELFNIGEKNSFNYYLSIINGKMFYTMRIKSIKDFNVNDIFFFQRANPVSETEFNQKYVEMLAMLADQIHETKAMPEVA